MFKIIIYNVQSGDNGVFGFAFGKKAETEKVMG
jgi:hypothetical protein